MADDKTTKTPEQPVTDTGPGKESSARAGENAYFPRRPKKRRNSRQRARRCPSMTSLKL